MKSSVAPALIVLLLAAPDIGLAALGAVGDESANPVAHAPAAAELSRHVRDRHPEIGAELRFAPSKPMSVIHLVKPERYLASSGDTLTVNLTLMASVPVEAVTVVARAEKGIVISGQQQDLGALAPGEPRRISLGVTVLAEGRHYINVLVSAETVQGVRKSSYSVPIEAGDAQLAAKKRRHTVTDDQGNTLLLMPAKTTTGDEQPLTVPCLLTSC